MIDVRHLWSTSETSWTSMWRNPEVWHRFQTWFHGLRLWDQAVEFLQCMKTNRELQGIQHLFIALSWFIVLSLQIFEQVYSLKWRIALTNRGRHVKSGISVSHDSICHNMVSRCVEDKWLRHPFVLNTSRKHVVTNWVKSFTQQLCYNKGSPFIKVAKCVCLFLHWCHEPFLVPHKHFSRQHFKNLKNPFLPQGTFYAFRFFMEPYVPIKSLYFSLNLWYE